MKLIVKTTANYDLDMGTLYELFATMIDAGASEAYDILVFNQKAAYSAAFAAAPAAQPVAAHGAYNQY